MKDVMIVGWLNKGKPADCGETMKNQLIINKLEEMGVKCQQMDFKGWRRHPWVFIQLAWNMVIHRDSTLILSTSAQNVYLLMKIMKKIKWKQNVVHWVIGGSLGQKVEQGIYKPEVLGYMNHTLVESHLMVEQLEAAGVKGLKEVPNFKPIPYFPPIKKKYPQTKLPLHFVFFSRIMPEKGCDHILEAARMLNDEGYEKKYSIDFFGKIADSYEKNFLRKLERFNNICYKGFLNLRENTGYDKLSGYDLMLFPTYWKGEGFAGVFIDAFVSGLPIITTDWAHNRVFLEEGKTALFVPVHDVVALHDKIKECIDGKYDIDFMAKNCQNQAVHYNIDNVITKELLEEIGVM